MTGIIVGLEKKIKLWAIRVSFAFLFLLIGCVSGLVIAYNHQTNKVLKVENKALVTQSKNTASNANLASNLEGGLIDHANQTSKNVQAAKDNFKRLAPRTQICGPTDYVIRVEGATPSDVWRAYVDGRNSVLYPSEETNSSGASVHTSKNLDNLSP